MSNDIKQRFYPLKPVNRNGFKQAVAWLGGRELVASLKGVIIHAIYGENMDPRSWMKPNIYPNIEEEVKFQFKGRTKSEVKKEIGINDEEYKDVNEIIENQTAQKITENPKIKYEIRKKIDREWVKKIFDHWEWKRKHFKFWEDYLPKQDFWLKLEREKSIDEFWFDYIADSGDGQLGVYSVGCMCFSDLWLTGDKVGSKVKFAPPADDEEMSGFQLLPRGTFLFVGGDTAYHSANYSTLFERFQTPFRWAFMSVRKLASSTYILKRTSNEKFFLLNGEQKNVFRENTSEPVEEWDGTIGDKINDKLYWDTEPLHPIFGVPANHDYYDSIDGFNKQFRRSPFEEIEENMFYENDDKGRMVLQIPTFSREQEASYVALHLPFDWWMFGIDSENEKLDYRQEVFFKQIMKRKPKKLILTTPEPTTVFGKKCEDEAKTATYLKTITKSLGLKQPFLTDGRLELDEAPHNESDEENDNELESAVSQNEKYCRLDLSGDIHHYARYWGKNTRKFDNGRFSSDNYASVVAGGGGAFFDATETLIGYPKDENDQPLIDKKGRRVYGEIPPQKIFPSEAKSVHKTADRIFDLWNIKRGGYVQTAGAVISIAIFFFLTQFSNASDWFMGKAGYFNTTIFIAGLFLAAVAALTAVSAFQLNKLINTLKEKQFKNRIDKSIDGRIIQLTSKFYPLFIAIGIYLLFILMFKWTNHKYHLDTDQNFPFTNSIFLLLHIIIALLTLWLSFDYANWLPVRFKISRDYKEKTYTQKMEDPNEPARNKFEELLGIISRNFSYRYVPSHILVILTLLVLFFGITLFGNDKFTMLGADLLLIIVILGSLVVITWFLAVNTGAYYQTTGGKIIFFFLGLWHAILQISVPFILIIFTPYPLLLFLILLVFFVNGFSLLADYFNSRVSNKRKDKMESWEKILYKFLNYRFAVKLMKKRNRFCLTAFWVVYGLIFLITPFIFERIFPDYRTVYDYFEILSRQITSSVLRAYEFAYFYLPGIVSFIQKPHLDKLSDRSLILLSFLFVGYAGYRMSRVWFSWYLAVSLAFNGHNNEAGGAARIEGFKHILRIKVEENKLTVYVIGFDEAQPELKDLELKLVDKFELECQPIQKTAAI